MTSPTIRLSQQHAIDVDRRHVSMCVAHEDHINAWDFLRDLDRFVFVQDLSRTHFAGTQIFFETHVHRDDDDDGLFLFAQDRHPLACFDKWLMKLEASIIWWIVPVRNSRSGEPKYADSDA